MEGALAIIIMIKNMEKENDNFIAILSQTNQKGGIEKALFLDKNDDF